MMDIKELRSIVIKGYCVRIDLPRLLLDAAREKAATENTWYLTSAAEELLRMREALEQIANESTRNLGSARIIARAALKKVGAGGTADVPETGFGDMAQTADPSGSHHADGAEVKLNKAMPQWVEQIVLCEELYDAKKGIWIDCMGSFKEQS